MLHPEVAGGVLLHHALLGRPHGPGRISVEMFQGERLGAAEACEPQVRIFHLVNGREQAVEISPSMAVDLSELLSGASVTGLWELTEALARAGCATDR